jgi:hypothetical protein
MDPEHSTFVRVYPNPGTSYFTVDIASFNSKENISLRIIDIAGRVVEVRSYLAGNQTLKIGSNLKAGLYVAELRQGNDTKQIRILSWHKRKSSDREVAALTISSIIFYLDISFNNPYQLPLGRNPFIVPVFCSN